MRLRKDGSPAAAVRRHNFNPLYIKQLRPEGKAFKVWDTHQRGLAVITQPSGHKSFYVVYSRSGRPRWYHIGNTDDVPMADARHVASEIRRSAALGNDPVAERRTGSTFSEIATRYREEHAKKTNKSWKQSAHHVDRLAMPLWSELRIKDITRADVRKLMASIKAPMLANQTLAACSAIFAWAIKQDIITGNPCHGIERNGATARERVLSDAEIPLFWAEFDKASPIVASVLKVLLLTGQRPGEIAHMRGEHIVDGCWWQMPGLPQPNGWPGLKNKRSHRVYLSEPVRAIIAERRVTKSGFVFGALYGRPITCMSSVMARICSALGAERATPHDLRRTFCTTATGLGFRRHAMHRVINLKSGGIADVHDRHGYAQENKVLMEAVSAHILALATGMKPRKLDLEYRLRSALQMNP